MTIILEKAVSKKLHHFHFSIWIRNVFNRNLRRNLPGKVDGFVTRELQDAIAYEIRKYRNISFDHY